MCFPRGCARHGGNLLTGRDIMFATIADSASLSSRELMASATKTLAESEAGAKKQAKSTKSLSSTTRFSSGTEWELLQTDAMILHALTLALKYVLDNIH